MKVLPVLALALFACSASLSLSASARPLASTRVLSSEPILKGSWTDAMTEAVSFLVSSRPSPSWPNYMTEPATTGSQGHARVGSDSYEAEMSNWPIPAEFKDDAAACVGVLVLAATEGQYIGQSFVFSLAAGQGSLTSLVVVAKRDPAPADPDRPVDVAYYVFSTTASVKQQYMQIHTEDCYRCGKCVWLWNCCCDDKIVSIPRGMLPAEVLNIALRMQESQYEFYWAYPPHAAVAKHPLKRATTHKKSPHPPAATHLGLKRPVADLLKALARFITRPEVKQEVTGNYSDPIVAQLQNVTQTIYSTTSHSHLKGVQDELFDRLMTTLTRAYGVYEPLSPFFSLDRHAPAFSHEVMLQQEGSSLMQYVWIMGTRQLDSTLHDVYLLNTKLQFDITRANVSGDVNVVRTAVPTEEGSFDAATFSVIDAPWADNTTEVAIDILRYVAALSLLEKPAPLNLLAPPPADYGLQAVHSPADLEKQLGQPLAVVESIIAITTAVKAVADTWQSVANAFKTTIQQDVKQIIRLGFNKFHQKSTVMKAFSVPEAKVEPFVNLVIKAFQLPDDDQAKLVLFEMQYLPEATWDADDFMYAIPGTGTDKAFMMFKTANSTSGLADFFVVNIEADFNLAPDLLVVRTQRSFLGGIFSDDKTRVEEIPHVLSMSDAVNLQNFFKIVAMGKMCEVLGIPYTYPTIPPL